MRISDWSSDVCSSDLRFAELSWPWELSTAPNYIEFVGLDVESDAPSRQHPALIGKQGIETLIGRGQPRAQRLQCGCIGQSVKFQQIAQAADYRADAEAKRVVDHQCDPQRIALHPEPPGEIGRAHV